MGIVYPKRCVLCRKYLPALEEQKYLCESCTSKAELYRFPKPSVYVPGADEAAAPLRYTGSVRRAMVGFKFYRRRSSCGWFVEQMLPVISRRFDEWKPDLVTFAPIGWLRYHERGYNQAEMLARPIAEAFGLPCQGTLKKQLFAKKQSKRKNAAARWKNSKKMFKPMNDTDLTGKRILFVDDIITTGATAAAAVNLLHKMGAERVYVVAPTRVNN